MQIETRNDLRLIGRAMNESWDVPKQKVVTALMEVIDRRDPDLMMEAAKLLLKADEINAKREAVQQRQMGDYGDQRLRLLELAQRIPAAELARRGRELGILPGDDGEGESASVDGEEAGGRA